jgi:hypothetical protein
MIVQAIAGVANATRRSTGTPTSITARCSGCGQNRANISGANT